MSAGLRIDSPVSLPTTSMRRILSGLVRLTLFSIFLAAASMISSVDVFVKRFSTVIRKVSSRWICWANCVAACSISCRSVWVTFWIGITRRVKWKSWGRSFSRARSIETASWGWKVVCAVMRPEIPVLSVFGSGSPIWFRRYHVSEQACVSLPRVVVMRRLKS